MPDFSWKPTSPLRTVLHAGRHGEKAGAAGVKLVELTGFDLTQVMARRGRWEETVAAAQAFFGVAAPDIPLAVTGSDATLIWSGPHQFLALWPAGYDADSQERLAGAFAGVASLSEQSDGRAMIRISGPRARDTLAKICSLDLHPSVFPVGAAATTSIDHTAVNLWRGADDAEGNAVFDMLVFSTFAGSLWHMMLDHAAEYGVDVGRKAA